MTLTALLGIQRKPSDSFEWHCYDLVSYAKRHKIGLLPGYWLSRVVVDRLLSSVKDVKKRYPFMDSLEILLSVRKEYTPYSSEGYLFPAHMIKEFAQELKDYGFFVSVGRDVGFN